MAFSAVDILEEFVEAGASRRSRWRTDFGELTMLVYVGRSDARRGRGRRLSKREIHARYRERHRSRIRERQDAWVTANREKRRAQARAYYYRHRETVRQRNAARQTCKDCKAPKAPGRSRCVAHLQLCAEKSRARMALARATLTKGKDR